MLVAVLVRAMGPSGVLRQPEKVVPLPGYQNSFDSMSGQFLQLLGRIHLSN